jgi:hypothetical protein
MLRHSYLVQVKELKTTKLGLELDLLKYPNQKDMIEKKLLEIEQEIKWYEDRIKNGRDPGCHII